MIEHKNATHSVRPLNNCVFKCALKWIQKYNWAKVEPFINLVWCLLAHMLFVSNSIHSHPDCVNCYSCSEAHLLAWHFNIAWSPRIPMYTSIGPVQCVLQSMSILCFELNSFAYSHWAIEIKNRIRCDYRGSYAFIRAYLRFLYKLNTLLRSK